MAGHHQDHGEQVAIDGVERVNPDRACAVVIGGYVNGYGVVRSLAAGGVRSIVVLDGHREPAFVSNKVRGSRVIEMTPDSLLAALAQLAQHFDFLVPFPTSDMALELLSQIADDIRPFTFIPFNEATLSQALSKRRQYEACGRVGVATPVTTVVETVTDLDSLHPDNSYVVKPTRRNDGYDEIFRTLVLAPGERDRAVREMAPWLEMGHEFLVSEIIPGDGSQLYGYNAYRSREGRILAEWTGHKLAQHPSEFGVMSSGVLQQQADVRQAGRALAEELDLYGLFQPEFKFDRRDGTYKLMEVNMRSHMYSRTGMRAGINLPAAQFADATGQPFLSPQQGPGESGHFVYLAHETANLIARPTYWPTFRHNVFGGSRPREFVFLDRTDPLPLLFLLRSQAGVIGRAVQSRWSGRRGRSG